MAQGYLGNVDSGESSEVEVSLFIHGSSVRELGRIWPLGRKWWAVGSERQQLFTTPGNAGQAKPAQKRASSDAAFEKSAVLLDASCAITGGTTMDQDSQSRPSGRRSTGVSRNQVAAMGAKAPGLFAPPTGESQVRSPPARASRGEHRAASPSIPNGVSREQISQTLASVAAFWRR